MRSVHIEGLRSRQNQKPQRGRATSESRCAETIPKRGRESHACWNCTACAGMGDWVGVGPYGVAGAEPPYMRLWASVVGGLWYRFFFLSAAAAAAAVGATPRKS